MSFFKGVGGSSLRVPFRSGLAHERVRYVGEPVALIVAQSEYIAQDAAELIEIEYQDLPVLVTAHDAAANGAVRVHDEVPDNLAFDYEYGNRESTKPGFTQAAHVVRVELHAQRISGNPMEPKSCTALYDAAADVFEVCIPTQGTGDLKAALSQITGLPPENSASDPPTSAVVSACATRSTLSFLPSCWPPNAPASRSSGSARARRRCRATTTAEERT